MRQTGTGLSRKPAHPLTAAPPHRGAAPTKREKYPAKVVLLLQDLLWGGSQTQALELARGLDPARFRVKVWTLMDGPDLLPRARAWGVDVRQLGRGRLVWPAALARLGLALRRERPDLILLYTAVPNIWGRLLGRLTGVPVIVATCRGSLEPRRQWDRLLWPLAHHHLCNARWLRDLLVRGSGVDPRLVSVIPNGVDARRFHPAPRPSATPVILFLGRLSPEKDPELLLRAFSLIAPAHPTADLWLAGEGRLKKSLLRRAEAGPWRGRIRVLPGSDDAASLLRSASLLALPSRHEGMPNAALEAMAAGLPVLAADLGGNAEVVVHGRTGLLLPGGDAHAWAAGLDLVLGDPDRGRAWGRAGRARVLERFTLEVMVTAHQELLARLLAERG